MNASRNKPGWPASLGNINSRPRYPKRSAREDCVLVRWRSIVASLFGWLVAWGFWLSVTHRFHPTFALALIVTTSLIVAFASASYCNHLVLIPLFWASHRRWEYVRWLFVTMAMLTVIALAIIRSSYFNLFGPDSDPNGVYKHFAIDFFGMMVHVAVAALLVWTVRPLGRMAELATVKAEQSDAHKSPVGREFES